MTSVRTAAVTAIAIGDRARQSLGDIDALAESIRTIGLLHPVVVTPAGQLVAGHRRLKAVRRLGWTEVPVTVAHDLETEERALLAERDENTQRLDFTPEEAVRVRRRIHAVVEARAKQAQRDHGGTAPGRTSNTSANLAEVKPRAERETRHVTARATGYGATTLDKAEAVVAAAEADDTPDPVREVAREAVAQMNDSGKVDGAHRRVQQARDAHTLDQAGVNGDADVLRMRLLSNAYRCVVSVRQNLLALDPTNLAAAIHERGEEWVDWQRLADDSAAWHAALADHYRALQRRNLIAIDGGQR